MNGHDTELESLPLGHPPLLVTLYQDVGKLPAGFNLELPRQIALTLVRERLAVPVAALKVKADAVIDCVWEDIWERAELAA